MLVEPKDFIKRNIQGQATKTREQIEQDNRLKQINAKKRRNMSNENERRKLFFLLNKNMLIKNYRNKERQKVLNQLEAQRWTQTWCRTAKTFFVIRQYGENLMAIVLKRRLKIAIVVLSQRVKNFLKFRLSFKGKTAEKRLRLETKSTFNFSTQFTYEAIQERAKETMASFLQKCNQVFQFKLQCYDFIKHIVSINTRISERLEQNILKMQHLNFLFERELHDMKVYYYKNYRAKSNQKLTVKLSAIPLHAKQALLDEYFKMCRLMFKIRSYVNFTWDKYSGALQAKKIRELYTRDEKFRRAQARILQCFFNLFEGTNPRQKVRDAYTLKILKTKPKPK